MPFVREWLSERYAAPLREDLGDPAGVAVAVVGGGGRAGAEEMDALPDLRAIVNFGVGYDNVDVAEAQRRGIVVSNTPDVLTDAVADLAAFLVVDVLRGITAADRFVRTRCVGARREDAADPRRARRGRRRARPGPDRDRGGGAARGLRCRDPLPLAQPQGRRVDLPRSPVALAAASDVLVVLTPGGAGTDGLVDAAVLDALGPEGYLVNVARGSVVDEDALVSALEAGRIAGAGLDVFADEPRVPSALLERDDVVLLPHVGSATVETREAMGRLVLDNVDALPRSRRAGDPGRLTVPRLTTPATGRARWSGRRAWACRASPSRAASRR